MKWILGVSMMIAVAMGWAATAMIPVATASIDDVSLKFLPSDTQGLAFVDVAGLRNSPLAKDVLTGKTASLPKEADDFIAATGFDPERDLEKVTLAKLGVRDALIIVQGRIDRFKVEQYLKDKGKPSEAYLGQTVYHDGDTAFIILDNVAVVGQMDAVKKAIDQMQLPGSQPLRSDLLAAIQSIEGGNQVWAAGDFSLNDLGQIGVRGPAPAMDMLKALKGGTYQMRVDTGIHARAIGNFTDAESAKNISDLGRGALAIAKLQIAKQSPEIMQLLDGIQISSSGTTLTVRVEESGEVLQKLKDLRPTIERNLGR